MLLSFVTLKSLMNNFFSLFSVLFTALFLLSCAPETSTPPNTNNQIAQPVIDVTGMPTQTVVSPYRLQLNAQHSTGEGLTYSWTLNDENISDNIIFDKELEAGTYEIKLSVSNGVKTSTEVFEIVVEPTAMLDADNDNVPDNNDICSYTSASTVVNADGCSEVQLDNIQYNKDDDYDGTINGLDYCSDTVAVAIENGCSNIQIDANSNNTDIDADADAILNVNDQCPNTVKQSVVDINGCSQSQLNVIEYNNDDDSDNVMNGLDMCPAQTGTELDGCLTAEKMFEENCEACHGNSQGQNVAVGGALTYFACTDCETKTKLVHTIETTMPSNDADACDNYCANKIADYILSQFLGHGENLTGQQLYAGLCQGCHGDGEETTGFTAPHLIPATCTVCENSQDLITKISNTMPFNDSAKCDLDCATKITQYMFDNFSGYAGLVEQTNKNLNAKGDLTFAFIDNQLNISWEQRSDIPDNWLLERLNETTQQWDLMQYELGNINSFTDSVNSIGMYRLYAITDSIASVPVYGQASAMTITADNGSVWGEKDGFFFLHKNITGNFIAEVTLHVKNDPSEWSKIGLMARNALTEESAHIFGYYNGNKGMEVSRRLTASAETDWLAGGGADLPVRIRLQRTGSTFVISTKEEGADWTAVTSQSVSLSSSLNVGVAISSNYGDFALVAKLSAFTIDNQIITDYSESTFGNFADGMIDMPSPVQNDESVVGINPKVEEQDLSRINRFVFNNQLEDISGQQNLSFNLTQDDTSSGFEVGLNSSVLSIEKYLSAAESFASIVAPSVQTNINCDLDDSLCINDFIISLTTEYWRTNPSVEQITNLNNVYWIINDQLGQTAAVQGLIETLVQSPAFLYQFEFDGANMPAGTLVPITGLSMAYRLANTLWAGMPDSILLTTALRGELSTPNQIKTQALRMLEDDKAKRGFNLFYRQWLELNDLNTTQKDIAGFDFDVLAPQMLEAMDFYMNSIVFDDQTPSSLNDLFTAPLVANNNALMPITNISSNSAQMTMADTMIENGDQRTGILGQPAMLALLGHAQTTSIVHRGVFISKQFMCAGFPPPPDNVPQLDSIDTTGKSSRQVLDELTSVDGCVDCHKFINPVGATLEHFDTLGRSRLNDDLDVLVDSSADIYSRNTGLVDGSYNGLKEFNEYLASLESVKSCFVTQYLTYAIGRVPSTNERNSVNWLVDQLELNNGNIKQMLVEATQTPVFLYKKTKQVGE